jgi:nucleotide-binding universal stress UspA family protein
MSTQGTIVVGVDGSDCSRTALEFALEEAVRRQAALRVVSALPEAEYWATASGMSPSLSALSRSPPRPGTDGRKSAPRPEALVLGTFDTWAWALGLLPRTCPSDHAGGMTVTAGGEV